LSGKILVVDDEPHVLYLLRIVLKTEGFPVSVCSAGDKVLEAVRTEQPSLIILDIVMPEMSGWEICRALREKPETREIPIIILSALPFKEEERRLARELRIVDYITKPFEPLQLLAKVKGLLGSPRTWGTGGREVRRQPEIQRGISKEKIEVLILGGGMAGLAAAYAARKAGAQVLLAEEGSFLAKEIVAFQQLAWSGPLRGAKMERFFELVHGLGGTRYSPRLSTSLLDPEISRQAAFSLLKENQVSVRMNAHLLDVIRQGTTIQGVVLESSKGPERLECAVVIDTTTNARLADLIGIPTQVVPCEPEINVLIGGIQGEVLEKGGPNNLHALPSMQDAVLMDFPLGNHWETLLYEKLKETLDQLRALTPGCKHAYLLRRPLSVITERRIMNTEEVTPYTPVIPKTYERVLFAGDPILRNKKSIEKLASLYHFGKIAGILAGISVEVNQPIREISQTVIREALAREGVLEKV